mmetsp:Transcript_2329/g.4881  ORF Transcript_2329/g.4881 Transcript_2329/m.4881 type:complete len:405 (+) Transcript_2329:34-1248(+)
MPKRHSDSCFAAMAGVLRGRKAAMEAVKRDGRRLRHASMRMRNDAGVVKAAVKRAPLALMYASDRLRNDRSIVRLAVAKMPKALKHASKELRADRRLVELAISKDGMALRHAAIEHRRNKQLVLRAIEKHPRAVRSAARKLKADRDVIAGVVSQISRHMEYVDDRLRRGSNFVWQALNPGFAAAQSGARGLLFDRDIAQRAVSRFGGTLMCASEELCSDTEVVKMAVGNWPRALEYAAQDAAEQVVQDTEFMRTRMAEHYVFRVSMLSGKSWHVVAPATTGRTDLRSATGEAVAPAPAAAGAGAGLAADTLSDRAAAAAASAPAWPVTKTQVLQQCLRHFGVQQTMVEEFNAMVHGLGVAPRGELLLNGEPASELITDWPCVPGTLTQLTLVIFQTASQSQIAS